MQEAITFLIETDAVMARLYQEYGTPVVPTRPPGFVTMTKLILEQQVSIESARACFSKLEILLGTVNPQTLLSLSEEQFRTCGISRQKTNYLTNLAVAVTEGHLDFQSLSKKSTEEIRAILIQLKGIGDWTIEVYLLFALQRPDVLPLGDVAIVRTLRELYGCVTRDQMEKVTQRWKPYRSMATFFLWHYYLRKRNRSMVW